jgi:RsiW-degrading membrane proteinase PrsW (M82 family)
MGSELVVSWALALVPVLLLTLVFIWLDVFKLMSTSEILVLLLLGGLVAGITYPISGAFLDTLPIGFNLYSRFVAPWLEEALKAAVIITLFRFNRIGIKLDAVITGFAVGAGFSVIENILYLLRFDNLPPAVWMVRGLGTAIMHGTTMAIMAAIAHEFAERNLHAAARDFRFNPLWFVPGFLAAVAIHTVFNQFPREPMLAMLGTLVFSPIALISIFRFGTREADQWLAAEQKQHQVLVDTLHSGTFPDDPAWKKVADLGERLGPDGKAMIRDYVTVLSELVLSGESAMLAKTDEKELAHNDELGAKFERLSALQKRLGKTTLAALTALLPFSRNDYWELKELREDVKSRPRASVAPLPDIL